MNIKKYKSILFLVLPFLGYSQTNPLELWYTKPASQWEETLPLGNGRLGIMPDGGVTTEKLVLNEITLWSGSPQDANNYQAYSFLPQIRELLLANKNKEAQKLIDEHFICKGAGSGSGNGADVPFGAYQVLGNMTLKFDYKTKSQATNYTRNLDIQTAVAATQFTIDGVTYKREYFAGFGDDAAFIKLTSSKKGKLNFTVQLDRPERFKTVNGTDNSLVMRGQLNNGTDGKGMKYKAKVKAQIIDGNALYTNNLIEIKNATEVVIFISAGTDYKDKNFESSVDKILDLAMQKKYQDQKKLHIENYQKLFNRVTLNFGKATKKTLPTNERLDTFIKEPDADTELPVLFYQYGRYLSISSTRVGLLPPNLQGIWANNVQTPWNADYHLDVNVQMNHWALETANLSELNLPLKDMTKAMVANGEKTAKAYYNADGWVAHVITNVWGFTEPGESASWGITKSGSGWLCNNLWSHYLYTNDQAYLAEIYPVLKGAAQFYKSMLVKDPETGWLVTSPSVSPENSFLLPNGDTSHVCMGPTIDNQIIRELFNNVIIASKKLGLDNDLSIELEKQLKLLPPPGVVGPDGRIQEWLKPYKEEDPQHRHISHLYALYPGSLITPENKPELVDAIKKTLEVRGDDGPSWSIAYKMLFWSRLKEGNKAYRLLKTILRPTLATNINYGAGGGVYPNLLSAGPPFQIDGNFGAAAGIGEMLIQSHAGFIELLPAMPDVWLKEGEVKGLKAEGNFTINIKWEKGKVTKYEILSATPTKVKVKVNGELKEITSSKL
ncbi:glycosyl hydrolase family 95 catalytic domain-containing protein [Flavobacterium pectinovorum]|uniref:Glycoside hydrolase family 95 protein n=1 Tax=Flavobacterium pectinovorum TaxID=29533 RepID=A0A502EW41_9FLAO|nr:glycoside hydrolase family 95 protein [Flavobacterium pectinovorum]TPG40790.1 glycoside hydrolase family 95 protein [Flavobacterium pectinovorum]